MPFSDEFDLDLVTSGNGIPGGNQPQSTSSEVSWAVSSLIIGSVLTGCTGDCVSSACSDNCSDNCTSANSCGCHVIIVALVDGESTLKRFFYDEERQCVRLHPENRRMKDIYVRNCYIQGVAQKVIKDLA